MKQLTDNTDAGSRASEISGHELERILDFVERFFDETEQALDIHASARELRISVPLLRGHLRGRQETPSSLISRSGMPRGTAHRTIEVMVAAGLILKRNRTRSGKTFTLHPSPKMMTQWLEYARRMKSVVGTVFGLARDKDYFFGASYLSNSVIPPLGVMDDKLTLRGNLRILLHADPAFMAMQKVKPQFELHFGTKISVRALSLDRLRQEILNNSRQGTSKYDIVTCDICWMAEMIEGNVVRPLGADDDPTFADLPDFHPEALATASAKNQLYGLPHQTTPELLVYRSDIFAERGLRAPETLAELLSLAKALHGTSDDMAGICWNGAQGTPVGTTFMMLMADFGQPVLALPEKNGVFSDRPLLPEHYRPALDTDVALEAAEYLVELLSYSPDTVLQMSWYERAICYATGQAAIAYCYTQAAQIFENDPASPVYRKTGYTLHPNVRREARMAPLGGWNLCIPVNLAQHRVADVTRAIKSLSSASATKLYLENGSMVSSRFSVCNDPSVAHAHPTIPIVDRIARSGKLQSWPRPAVPELNELVSILGYEIHTMLLRNKRPREALRDAQARCDTLMQKNGRY